jgi:hypothetical protein
VTSNETTIGRLAIQLRESRAMILKDSLMGTLRMVRTLELRLKSHSNNRVH